MNKLETYASQFTDANDKERAAILSLLNHEEKLSLREIAKLFTMSLGKISRLFQKYEIQPRSKSEVQKDKIQSGKVEHPTKGKKLSEETKRKISDVQSADWKNNPESRAKAAEATRLYWSEMDEQKKKELLGKCGNGIREASKKGSKLEHLLSDAIIKNGFASISHKTRVLPNEDLEFDLYIPEIATIIEVDGPSHSKVIWNEKTLEKNKKRDKEKSGTALNMGFNFVRVIQDRNLTDKYVRVLSEKLVNTLKEIKRTRPKSFYVEINEND